MHVTVLMAVYNGEMHLEKCVKSVQAQSFTDWDFVIINDGSTDSSADILRRLSSTDKRIEVITNTSNRGLAYSLNLGWRRACGELIARVDVDDENMPNRLEVQEQFMRLHQEIDVLGSAAELVNSSGEVLGISCRPERHVDLAKVMYKESPFFHSSVMVRKSFYARIGGYDEKIRFSQDIDMWLRAFQNSCFHNLSDALIRHQVRPRQKLLRTWWALYVLARRAYLDGCLISKGRWVARYGLSAIASWFKVHEHRVH